MYDLNTTKKLDAIYDRMNELENEVESLIDGLDAMELEVDDNIVAIKNAVNDKITALELKIEKLQQEADHIEKEARDNEEGYFLCVVYSVRYPHDVIVSLSDTKVKRKFLTGPSGWIKFLNDSEYEKWKEMRDIAQFLNVNTSSDVNIERFTTEIKSDMWKIYDKLAKRYIELKQQVGYGSCKNLRFAGIPYFVD